MTAPDPNPDPPSLRPPTPENPPPLSPPAPVGRPEPLARWRAGLRARPAQDRWTQLMRLILAWCVWLMASLAINWRLDGMLAGGRWFTLSAASWLLLVWPAWRLSLAPAPAAGSGPGPGRNASPEAATRDPGLGIRDSGRGADDAGPASSELEPAGVAGGVLAEWFAMVWLLAVIAWFLRLTAEWRVDQTAWLVAAVAAWSLLTSAVVAWGSMGRDAGRRWIGMAGCIGLAFGSVALRLLAGPESVSDNLGIIKQLDPWSMLMELGAGNPDWSVRPWLPAVASVFVAAAAAWAALGGWVLVRSGRRPV